MKRPWWPVTESLLKQSHAGDSLLKVSMLLPPTAGWSLHVGLGPAQTPLAAPVEPPTGGVTLGSKLQSSPTVCTVTLYPLSWEG